MAWILPLPEGSFRRGSPYGRRQDPFAPTKIQFHNGLDFRCPLGTPVLAVDAGTIAVVNRDQKLNAGIYVILRHTDGCRTSYCHLGMTTVEVGDAVQQGQGIGLSGSTGASTGPHLHFVARDPAGNYLDPAKHLPPLPAAPPPAAQPKEQHA